MNFNIEELNAFMNQLEPIFLMFLLTELSIMEKVCAIRVRALSLEAKASALKEHNAQKIHFID